MEANMEKKKINVQMVGKGEIRPLDYKSVVLFSPSGTVAGWGVGVVFAGGLLVVVGFGVGALGAVAGRVGDLDKAPAVEHKARPPVVGDEPPKAGRSG